LARLTDIRATDPSAVQKALARRKRRSLLQRGSLFLVAADHPARGVLKAGSDPMAMADRGELLRRLLIALERPGVGGVLGTASCRSWSKSSPASSTMGGCATAPMLTR